MWPTFTLLTLFLLAPFRVSGQNFAEGVDQEPVQLSDGNAQGSPQLVGLVFLGMIRKAVDVGEHLTVEKGERFASVSYRLVEVRQR